MNLVKTTAATALSLLLGIAAVPAFAQHDQGGQRQEGQKQEGKKQEGQKREGQRQDRPQRQDHQRAQPREQPQRPNHTQERHDRAQQQRPSDHAPQQSGEINRRHQAPPQSPSRPQAHTRQQADRGREPSRQRVEQRSAWQQHRARSWESEHRNWQQRGGYRGYRVPDDRYRRYFGPDHGFRIYGLPFMVVGGYPRFQYRGYWISTLDPWPEYWGDDWYDNDDVYVTYVDNGYYLYNRRYPRTGIAINISF